MNIKEDMERELEAAQKEYSEGNSFVLNRDLFLKHFFDSKTQASILSEIGEEAINLTGAGAGTLVATTIFAKTAGGLMLFLGATTPVGWLVGGAVGGYALLKLINKGRESAELNVYDKTAKFISCPMDQVAKGLCQLTMPVAIAAAYSDKDYNPSEREMIVKHFVQVWGLNPNAVDVLMTQFESMNPEEWDSLDFAETIKKSIFEMTKDATGIDKKVLEEKVCTGIVKLALQIVESDGVVHRSEKLFIKRLAKDLGVPELVSCVL